MQAYPRLSHTETAAVIDQPTSRNLERESRSLAVSPMLGCLAARCLGRVGGSEAAGPEMEVDAKIFAKDALDSARRLGPRPAGLYLDIARVDISITDQYL